MGAGAPEFSIHYELRLVEEAVIVAIRGRPEETGFWRRRDAVYEVPDHEARETRFQSFHADWFERLALGAPIAGALDEEPVIQAETGRCLVAAASSGRDEGAELFVAVRRGPVTAAGRTVVLRLRPETLTDPDRLRLLLRRELLHVADMLDPAFGYAPPGAAPLGNAVPDALLRERYRVLWDVRVDGRLARRGWVPPEVRAGRLREFAATFPMLETHTEAAFGRLFAESAHTHADLLAFAAEPERMRGGERRGPHLGQPCPLCGCPTYAFEPRPGRLPEPVRHRIRGAFPLWAPADGLCRQCADLFQAIAANGSSDA